MVTVKRLRELLKDLPDDAKCYGYEGESTGIAIYTGKNPYNASLFWWIDATDSNEEETHTTGFETLQDLKKGGKNE